MRHAPLKAGSSAGERSIPYDRAVSAPEPERLALLAAVADAGFQRAIGLLRVGNHFGKVVRLVFEDRAVCGDRRQPEFGWRTSTRLGDVNQGAVPLDDAQEFEGNHPIALDSARDGEHRA